MLEILRKCGAVSRYMYDIYLYIICIHIISTYIYIYTYILFHKKTRKFLKHMKHPPNHDPHHRFPKRCGCRGRQRRSVISTFGIWSWRCGHRFRNLAIFGSKKSVTMFGKEKKNTPNIWQLQICGYQFGSIKLGRIFNIVFFCIHRCMESYHQVPNYICCFHTCGYGWVAF